MRQKPFGTGSTDDGGFSPDAYLRPLTKPGSDSGSDSGSDPGSDRIGLVSSLLVQNYYFEKSCFNNDTGDSE